MGTSYMFKFLLDAGLTNIYNLALIASFIILGLIAIAWIYSS